MPQSFKNRVVALEKTIQFSSYSLSHDPCSARSTLFLYRRRGVRAAGLLNLLAAMTETTVSLEVTYHACFD